MSYLFLRCVLFVARITFGHAHEVPCSKGIRESTINCTLYFLLLMFVATPAFAYDWDYSSFKWDLTQAAVCGSRHEFFQWAVEPIKSINTQATAAVKNHSATLVKTLKRSSNFEKTTELVFKFQGVADSNADLEYSVVVVTPFKRNASKFPIIAFDGHGDCGGECSGKAPQRMFTPKGFAYKLAKLGYVVIGFPTAIHKPFYAKSKKIDYPIIWASLAREILVNHKKLTSTSDGYIAIGNAIGGLTALSLSIIDNNAKATIVNGAFFPLELMRREYRIKNHPFCTDFRAFNTYTSIYALLVPMPLMIQMGEKDALWLGNGAQPASDWFSGIKRGATVDETLGASFVLERIYKKFNAPYMLAVHKGEHENFDSILIDRFIRQFVGRKNNHRAKKSNDEEGHVTVDNKASQ